MFILANFMYYVYLLRCSDNTLYCGITNNIDRRVKEHNTIDSKGARYTKTRRPVQLVYKEEQEDITSAMKREREIKKWSKKRKEKIILKHLPVLCKNPNS